MGLIINGETVDDALVEQEFSAVKSYEASRRQLSCCEKDAEFRERAVENVISRVLLLQEAEKTTAAPAAGEVDDALRALKERHGGEAKFYDAFNLKPEQEPEIRRDVEVNLRIEKMLAAAAPETDPTSAELEGWHRAHIERYLTVEQVRASHIIKGGEDRAKAYKELRDVREKLLAGGDVEALWKEHSDTAKSGEAPSADLGWLSPGEILPEIETVAFSLREGEVSPVFASMYGYHILKAVERRPAVPRPLEEVRDRVRDDFVQDRRTSRVKAFLDALRARATIQHDK
ncbi:MAG TPA: peptidyl-prolyl cis-trans isomerase [Planctomycetota bacterium]